MRSIILTALLLSCSSSEKSSDAEANVLPDPGPGTDGGCDEDPDCADYQICDDGDCVDGDRSDGFSEAEDITASTSETDNSQTGHINVDEDKDYWRYVSSGGEFIRATIDKSEGMASDEEGALQPDLFLTLYDPDGEIVTSADNYANGGTVGDLDSVVYAYLRRAGDYTLVVEDANFKNGRGALSGPDYDYRLEVSRTSGTDDIDSSLEDPILFDSSSSIGIRPTTTSWRSFGVLIDEPGQVDYVAVLFDNDYLDPAVDIDPEGNPYGTWDDGVLFIDGVEDLRGSDATPLVQLLSPDDELVATGLDVGPTNIVKYPALTAGQYILALSDAEGGGGSNYWFYILLNADNRGTNIPFETEDNGSSSLANPIEKTDTENTSGNRFSQGSVQGFVNTAGDNDWYSMSAPADAYGENSEGEDAQWVVVCANSTLWGSSAAPRITVYDESGSVLGESESDGDAEPNVRIENLEISPGEQINIQVNSGADSEGAPDEWYRMKVFIASFQVRGYDDAGYSCP